MNAQHRKCMDFCRSYLMKPVYMAVFLILLAEMAYLAIWGIMMFPGGSLAGKILWVLTCTLAMGTVIGVATIFLVRDPAHRMRAILASALILSTVGIFCTILCGALDQQFNYFGGQENPALFLWSGIISSLLGGPVYGWLVYGRTDWTKELEKSWALFDR